MLNKMKLGALAAAAALATTFVSPSTQAATGTMNVDVTFPPLIILYYYPNVDVTVDADDLESLLVNGNAALTDVDTPDALEAVRAAIESR